MKKYFIFAASALALASCSSDDYLGGDPGNENGASNAINFAGGTGKTTRADNKVGATAANLLDKKFYVLGTKGTLPKTSLTNIIVFDNYQVNWQENTAGTTADNTNDWAYIGVTPTGLHAGTETITEQTIKYWDYSQPHYDFIAYSIGENTLVTGDKQASAKEINGSAIVTPQNDNNYVSYTLKANSIEDFAKCYITDVTPVAKENYGKPVQFTFRNLTAKVRVAFYETIPGYTVSNLQFYTDNSTPIGSLSSADVTATLYTTGDNDYIATNGDITVAYPVVGSDNSSKSGYNKAFVSVATDGTGTEKKLELGAVNYAEGVLSTSAKNACMAGEKEGKNYYTAVLPTSGNGKPLTIRMNYTLTSTDGSGEKINVYGASAVIPAAYTQWQPNYAYTYIFKISDNTNGFTSTDKDKEGLFPITFDAVVADTYEADFNQETVTTVSTPSVTTYAFNSATNKVVPAYQNEKETYPAGSDIYFSVAKDGKSLSLTENNKGQLYILSETNVDKGSVTEAEVIDALQVVASSDDQSQSITGRNGLTLRKQATKTDITAIPTEHIGKDITVDAGYVAKLSSSTAGTYAYVYDATEGTPTTTYIFTAITATGNEVVGDNEYCLTPAEGATYITKGQKLTAGQIYYKRYSNNNKTFGVKVVKIAE